MPSSSSQKGQLASRARRLRSRERKPVCREPPNSSGAEPATDRHRARLPHPARRSRTSCAVDAQGVSRRSPVHVALRAWVDLSRVRCVRRTTDVDDPPAGAPGQPPTRGFTYAFVFPNLRVAEADMVLCSSSVVAGSDRAGDVGPSDRDAPHYDLDEYLDCDL